MDIRVRNVESWIVNFLRDEADHAGHSLSEHLRQYLRDAALRGRQEWAEKLAAGREQILKRHGLLSDSAEGIRRDREERG